jgi:hypothetical protein
MNLESVFVVLVTGLAVWLASYAFYWWMIRPALVAKLRRHLCEQESAIVLELLESQRPGRISALRVLRDRAQRLRQRLDDLSLSRLCAYEASAKMKAQRETEDLIIAGADLDVRQLERELNIKMFFGILINSPVFALLGIGVVSLMTMFAVCARIFNKVIGHAWEIGDGSIHSASKIAA